MTEQTTRMTAKDLAGAYWEDDHSDRFRKMWPNAKTFIGRNWPTFVPMAKEIMVGMLNDPNTTQRIKDAVYDALVDENSRNANRKGATVGKGQLNLNPLHPGAMERKIFHSGD